MKENPFYSALTYCYEIGIIEFALIGIIVISFLLLMLKLSSKMRLDERRNLVKFIKKVHTPSKDLNVEVMLSLFDDHKYEE
jgi:hypothetical protein